MIHRKKQKKLANATTGEEVNPKAITTVFNMTNPPTVHHYEAHSAVHNEQNFAQSGYQGHLMQQHQLHLDDHKPKVYSSSSPGFQ